MSQEASDSILYFKCDSCGAHLGVDKSLAGTKAPCPKCGSIVEAIENEEEVGEERVSNRLGRESISLPQRASRGEVREEIRGSSRRRDRDRTTTGRNAYPASGRLAEEDEVHNLKALIKILVATLLVLLIASAVSWMLLNR